MLPSWETRMKTGKGGGALWALLLPEVNGKAHLLCKGSKRRFMVSLKG